MYIFRTVRYILIKIQIVKAKMSINISEGAQDPTGIKREVVILPTKLKTFLGGLSILPWSL